MVSSTKHHFFFVLITFIILLRTSLSVGHISSADGELPFSPKHVVIINKLTSRAGLVLHCTNKKKDLGFKAILVDESFDFTFRVNLRKTTQYTCTFSWAEYVKTFDIFRADRDDSTKSKIGICRECVWHISETGPCRVRSDGGAPFCFPWAS
ncbi:hypothetical protein EUTSA_v10009898mg [Eutrema salsugineum]|uniref:S-protein homolog n=1 Tax=Eutrema salsugineum TaxID=72664 RepID=V4KW92_EUTSA|nr:S-protein homolog 5 [Eutrema salsugineum]ESQ34312.1 hypothetical protein EUTSA_v10009898mg [Eutrema salsugineum]